jgi:uncharacterized protein YjbI with pentapeptide repeats
MGGGRVAVWLRRHQGELFKDLLVGFVVGVVLFVGALLWDIRLANRQDRLQQTLAKQQDELQMKLADQAEVLENTRFVRDVAVSGSGARPFGGLNLRGAHLAGLDLGCKHHTNREGMNLEGGVIQVTGHCSDFQHADATGANLAGTDLSGAYMQFAQLAEASMSQSDLSHAALDRADLRGIDFHLTNLTQASMAEADLRDATLSSLQGAPSNFMGADLRNAYLGFDFRRVEMHGAKLSGADLTNSLLRPSNLSSACYDNTTTWPKGFEPPKSGKRGC